MDGNPIAEYEKWSPRPEFAILVDGFPVLLIEICADPNQESDRYRMLLYAASILRASEVFPDSPQALRTEDRMNGFEPMIVACYIKNAEVSVYILYLEEGEQLEDETTVSIISSLGELDAHL